MDALVLAGGKSDNSFGNHQQLNNKALLIINGIPMIEYVVDALKKAREIDSIIVVGPKEELIPYIEKKVKTIIDSTDSIVENVKMGIDCIKNDQILIMTSDIPLITGEMIDDFIQKCHKYEAFLYYPFISRENILKKYPKTIRSYATLKEGVFCGGNLAVLSTILFNQNKSLFNELYQNRKDTKKYFTLLGLKFITKYLLKCLSIKEIEDRAAQIIGYPVKGIMINYPEIMIDLDKLSDYELIVQILNESKEKKEID